MAMVTLLINVVTGSSTAAGVTERPKLHGLSRAAGAEVGVRDAGF